MDNVTTAKTELVNTIKLLIYKEAPALLENINFDDDDIFLEPLLFSYFSSKREYTFSNELLEEVIQGYFVDKKELKIKHSYHNDIAYIPNVGYFLKDKEELHEPILKIGDFEILKEIHPTQKRFFREYYKGHILNHNPEYSSVWKENYEELFEAIEIIKKNLPEFYEQLVFSNKKIYLHDNPKILNFATVETLGALYFYVLGKNNLIYYIEELIHQGSHNFFYYVLQNKKDFFKIDVSNLSMREYTNQEWDYRDIYGAFHGLYTVTKRVECFDLLVSQNVFSGREKHELLGRFTDQIFRFRTGLELLDFDVVFTEKGKELYAEYDTRCHTILEKYKKLATFFDLSNRDLDFRYEDFCKLNPIEAFYKKEKEGFFEF
ncbi:MULTISPECIES: hypothetical protein [Flavobacterium]|jgi:hypothetical protein|uniref:Uncharacterized protein n=1 Tax=Flavobacterium cupriresistens TaxID=2893885 RepID=A0ABU4RFA0_9FLAO|nr:MULTISPECIES: hypothetical protein [unclassified Flavobacterium]KLT68357.1 hypothetical protein AB674_18155 [Flavobacterium sp. ABG]MDX6191272.1 hypothetical protein [Flavobacterium sp. Fl-318]UFH42410.1 hypothetical protein LNP23_21705 [Flavobacterium sp. F-323]